MPSEGIAAVMMFYMLNKIADCTENVVRNLLSSEGKKGGLIFMEGKQQIAKRRLFTLVGRAG
ncbi:hypothetical protein UA70_27365 [Raoultella planticola]|nr:hypothetical protein UA70_27365 [Raoultella planticola]